MITQFKIYESNDEILSILNTLNKYTSYGQYHDNDFGWVSIIYPNLLKGKDKEMVKNIKEYIRWRYNFEKDDDIVVDSLHTIQLYHDLNVYNDEKKLLFFKFHTDKFPNSKHSIIKKEFNEFIEFLKDPEMFIEKDKYNL